MAFHAATDDLIDFLNHLAQVDREWLGKLIETRVPCNEELLNHPTVQACAAGEIGPTPSAGVLGMFNGFCGKFDDGPRAGWGPITAEFDDDHKLIRFYKTLNEEMKHG